MKHLFLVCFLFSILAAGCQSPIKPEQLYGKWNYVKLENPNANSPSQMPDFKLKFTHPYIEFTQKDQLIMHWADTVLSHGTFKTAGQNINYKEIMPDGKTREYPFRVTKLTDKEITFETSGDDGTRVTAVREKR